jgi:hypothetical protein
MTPIEELETCEDRRVEITLADPKISGKLIEVDYEYGMVIVECCIPLNQTKKIHIEDQ